MAGVTYVKFMTREELIDMLKEIRTFSMLTKDGRRLVLDEKIDEQKPTYTDYDGTRICWHATAFKLNAFDYLDCIMAGEGYVRYSTWQYGKKETHQGIILRNRYGFSRED